MASSFSLSPPSRSFGSRCSFSNPAITGLALLFYIAVWALVTGFLDVIAAIRLRREITGEFWLVLAGLLSIGFGALLMARPGAGALAILWLIATYAILFGVILVALAVKARGFARRIETAVGGSAQSAHDDAMVRPTMR
ncbi:MAG TPA: DUF308 domain-containing protein [Gammaproteobacteria bacterium]